jgi:hypothetical protein
VIKPLGEWTFEEVVDKCAEMDFQAQREGTPIDSKQFQIAEFVCRWRKAKDDVEAKYQDGHLEEANEDSWG